MPNISGKEVISESTEKATGRALVLAGAAILTKLYAVPLNDLKVVGMELPAALIDATLLVLVAYTTYSFLLKWLGDLMAFRLWYRESSIWSEFGTNMKLDRSFLRGAVPLLERVHALETANTWPVDASSIDQATKDGLKDFKANAKLYCARLEAAGTRFTSLSVFGHYYVWVHSFAIPLTLSVSAIYLLLTYGSFTMPHLPANAA